MTTKKETKQKLQAAIDFAFNISKQRIFDMQPLKGNPQIALMIEKNRGYMMALEDVTELLYSHRIF